MPSEAADIAFIAFESALIVLLLGVCLCSNWKPENAAEGRAAQTSAAQAPAVRRMTAAAPPVRLRYFPYSTMGRRASEKLVCAICLEAFEHGEACGEVPACRHFFHRACVDLWKKSSLTCPLCRGYMTTRSSEPVSRADDMV